MFLMVCMTGLSLVLWLGELLEPWLERMLARWDKAGNSEQENL
jgi:hypothetical protein